MTFANPAGLWLLGLALPVIALHVLRPRRRTAEVSSTYLWREAGRPVSSAVPWQRLRPSWLLALQLVAVVLLAAAVARPLSTSENEALSLHTVFVLDASGSMASLDGDPDRFTDAQDRAIELRRQVPEGGIASVVVAGPRARMALSSSPDAGAFSDAVRRAEVTDGPADFAGAFALAASVESSDQPLGVVLLSDGGLTTAERRLIPPGTRYERVGERSTNRAISHLSVEPQGSGLLARVTVRNAGGSTATQTLRVDVDGRTMATERVRVHQGESTDIELAVPAGDRVEAFLEGEDLLDADDRARAVVSPRPDLEILLAGAPSVFLEQLLAAVPGITVERSPDAVAASGHDLVIYNQVRVPTDPGAPYWAIAPPGGSPGIDVTGTVERPAVTLVRTDDPLLTGLDLSEVAVGEAQRLDVDPISEVLVGAEQAPLLVRRDDAGQRAVYLAFPLERSNLPVQVVFPVLADRLMAELSGVVQAGTSLDVGDRISLLGIGGAEIDSPGASTLTVAPGGAEPIAERAGYYTVREPGRAPRTLAVNPVAGESDLAPVPVLPVEPRAARPGGDAPVVGRSLLSWFTAALLIVLAAEWLLSRRRRGVAPTQWRVATITRVGVATLVILALVAPTVTRSEDRVATMFVVDASASLGPGGRAAAVNWVQEALESQGSDDLAGVAFFGGDARLELTLRNQASLGDRTVRIDPDRTNLATALRLAAAVLPGDARRRVVLVTDGRATEGDVADEAARLGDAGVQVDVHTVSSVSGPDSAVTSVAVPSTVRTGEEIEITATIASNRRAPAVVELSRDGQLVEQRPIELAVGQHDVAFVVPAGEPRTTRFRVTVHTSDDTVGDNDIGYAAVNVKGVARVLMAEGSGGEAAALATALRSGGLTVELTDAAALPALEDLAGYDAIVLVDVDARRLTASQVAELGGATRDLGVGLVTVGGDQSYGLGGYLDSELEELLPVVSDLLDPKRRQRVAEVLAIDTSGSMGACHCQEGAGGFGGNMERDRGGVNKTDISRAAAARTIAALGANDEVGVLAFNTEQQWVVDLQTLPPQDVVESGLRRLTPAGGTEVVQPLEEAAEALRRSQANLRHIILFTDGFTAPGALTGLERVAGQLAEEGITVSVLATGEGAADELAEVAAAGEGRFYPGTDLEDIPQIMVEEARIASRSFINEGEFVPRVTSSAAPVRDLTATPPLFGYIGTTAKPTSRTLLTVGDEDDPLLASWQIGLGRATSWTSDASLRWSQAWASWDGYVEFWSGVVRDTMPATGTGGQVRAELDGDVLRITVEREEAWPPGLDALARVNSPGGASREVRLERASSTTFVAEVPAAAAGGYGIGVQMSDGATVLMAGSTVATQSYSIEYLPGEARPDVLAAVSRATGGRGEIQPSQAFEQAGLEPGRTQVRLSGWLLLLAALLFPIAIALSRLNFRGVAAATGGGARRIADLLPRRAGSDDSKPASPEGGEPDSRRAPAPAAPEPDTKGTLGDLLRSKRDRDT